MNKRTFLKLASALLGLPFTAQLWSWLAAEQPPTEALTNWAGNIRYGTRRLSRARSVEQVRQLVASQRHLKVLGTRHCFNRIADSSDALVSLRDMDRVVALDAKARTVTVEAGISYGQLCPYLQDRGFALHNLASLPHISVGGAMATATHGSGLKNGNLATAVTALELITAQGEVRALSRLQDRDTFPGAVVHLGALGVVTRVTLDLQPAFLVRQDVYLNLPMAQLRDHLDDILASGYSVSLFTDWQQHRVNEVWIKRRVEKGPAQAAAPEFYGAKRALKNVHPIAALSAENCTEQLGVPGPWYERLPHFRMGFTPSSGQELQSEYFVPLRHALDAILAVERLRDQVSPQLLISELRTVAADQLWMSPCYQRPSLAIHFTWKPDWSAVRKVLPLIEKELAPFEPRPHWGKLFTLEPAQLQARYDRLPAFRQLVKEYDPQGKFRNEFLARNLYG